MALLYPLSFNLGTLGRVDNGDGQFSIWNVAWVARTLVVDPLRVLDANIFYPHRWTLAYSEMNLGAGFLAVPAYWITRNPYIAHNVVLLLAFVLSGTGMYFLARYLSNDRRAAFVAGVCFAYAPHFFAHLPHIQLLMAGFIPVSLLAFHRLADDPTPRRGIWLGLAVAVQALLCAYYVVFLSVMLVYTGVFIAITRRYWLNRRYWTALGVAAVVAAALVGPLFVPYLWLQREAGFTRSLDDAVRYSANFSAYLASAAFAHEWMLAYLPPWKEVLFPRFLTILFGIIGIGVGVTMRGRTGEAAALYTSLGALAFWASFGPQAGLYTVLYRFVPGFTFMRAPSRFGLAVVFALSALAAIGIARWLATTRRPTLVAALVIIAALAESYVPLQGVFRSVPEFSPTYRILATLEEGALLELPVIAGNVRFARTQYMLASTFHWQPLVNAYSDYVPPDIHDALLVLSDLPSAESLRLFRQRKLRYAIFHLDRFGDDRDALLTRLIAFQSHLKMLYADNRTLMFEVVSAPDAGPAEPPQS